MAEVKASRVSKERKSLAYLQKCKDEGRKIVQMCPGNRDYFFTMAADMCDVDVCRLTVPGDGSDPEMQIKIAPWWIKTVHNNTKTIHINFYMQTPTYASDRDALYNGAMYMNCGADSLLCMGVTPDRVKYMCDNYLPLFGHIGALSGWQTVKQGGYKRMGKTAETAMEVFKLGYEYQENGMGCMTIELTPIEVTNAIAKKLRVPVISIAAGGAADGCEMVDFDTFGMMPSYASHAKVYAEFFPFACEAYMQWADDVREGVYPEDKHGYHMDPVEAEKFQEMLDKF